MDVQWGFSGISTFAHLPHVKCLTAQDVEFDIGIIGVPFDTAVSYRPGELYVLFMFRSLSVAVESGTLALEKMWVEILLPVKSHIRASHRTFSTFQIDYNKPWLCF